MDGKTRPRILALAFFLICAAFAPGRSVLAVTGPPAILKIVCPASVYSGRTFTITVTASSDIGLKWIDVRFEGKIIRLKAGGGMDVTLSAKLKAEKLGKRSIGLAAVDTKGVSCPPVRKTINVLGRIVTRKPVLVRRTRETLKEPDKPVLDADNLKAKPLEPAELMNFTVSIGPSPIIVGKDSEVVIRTDRPAPEPGVLFRAEILDAAGEPAGSFEEGMFDVQLPPGEDEAAFFIRSFKDDPAEVRVRVSLSDRTVEEKARVVMPATIRSLRIEGTEAADVVVLEAGADITCRVELDKPAEAGGASVHMMSEGPDSGLVELSPHELVIVEGESSGAFRMKVGPAAMKYFIVRARTHAVEKLITVNITPAVRIESFSLEPFTVFRGQKARGSIDLNRRALEGGADIRLVKTDYGAQFVTMPDSLRIPEGSQRGEFDLFVSSGAKRYSSFTITAVLSEKSRISRQYRIEPFKVSAVSMEPDILVNRESDLRLALNGPVPEGGIEFVLKIMTPAPENQWAYGFDRHLHRFTIPKGSSSASIRLMTTREYPEGVDVILSSSADDIYFERRIPVTPEQLIESLTVFPAEVLRGRSTLGTVTLNRPGLGGAATNVTLRLLSDWATPFIRMDSAVTVAVGQTEANFLIEIDGRLEGDKFYIEAEAPSGNRKSLEIRVIS